MSIDEKVLENKLGMEAIAFWDECPRPFSWLTSTGKIRKQTRLWTTKDGARIRICDMDDGHLANTIVFLERVANITFMKEYAAASIMASFVQGEMAEVDLDNFLTSIDEGYIYWDDYLPNIYYNLTMEKERRKGMEKTFFIAGVQHHPGMREVIKDLKVGTVLDLVPDPENKYDPNAVRIEYEENMLGYVPMKISAEVSGLMEVEELYCAIEKIDPSASPWEQCEVTVQVKEE